MEKPVPYSTDLPEVEIHTKNLAPIPMLAPSENWMPVMEAGDPLVVLNGTVMCVAAQYLRGYPGTCQLTYVRQTVAEALIRVDQNLPSELSIVVLDGHRSIETQRFLYNLAYSGTNLPPGFVADPDQADIIPPHTTGAAIDVTLSFKGEPLALGTRPGEYVAASRLAALEDTPSKARDLRRLLFHTMVAEGFCGIAEEWWHFSLGDQEWAHQKGRKAATCGSITRPF